MGHMRIDDHALDHPKFVRLEERSASRGLHLWLGLMQYAKLHLTDGRVPRDMLNKVNGPQRRWRAQALAALIDVKLVEVDGEDLVVHGFLEWNPSREKILCKPSPPPRAANDVRDEGDRGVIDGRCEGDARVIEGRDAPDNAVIDDRQHIKRDDHAGLGQLSLVHARRRARADSDSDSDSASMDPDPPSSPRAVVDAVAKCASTGSAPRRSVKSRARTQCPTDFQPDDTTQREAASLGYRPELELKTRREFVDYWRGEGKVKADWQATYRNRLRTRAEQLGLKPPKPDSPQHQAWRRQKAAAEAPVTNPAPRAREQLSAAVGKLFAHH